MQMCSLQCSLVVALKMCICTYVNFHNIYGKTFKWENFCAFTILHCKYFPRDFLLNKLLHRFIARLNVSIRLSVNDRESFPTQPYTVFMHASKLQNYVCIKALCMYSCMCICTYACMYVVCTYDL